MTWHILDARSIWIKEFSWALSQRVPVRAWTPRMSWVGCLGGNHKIESQSDPELELRAFPLQRGYARFPMSVFLPLGSSLAKRLESETSEPKLSPLICTTPYYAPVAERWAGPVVYYQTDLTVGYAGVDPAQVRSLDERLCRRADLVCPNSERIAEYMVERGCAPGKIVVIPNATRAANVLTGPAFEPASLPSDVADLPRPIAGVIGNLAANMDWQYLLGLVRRARGFTWIFLGPTDMPVYEAPQDRARTALLNYGSRVRFIGARPYGDLQSYARSFDIAVLPYRKQEPTYSGSSTRFYEHLAACRPMLATRSFAELLRKEPLLYLSDIPEESAHYLARMKAQDFRDGQETARWEASRAGTWMTRAATLRAALSERWPLLQMQTVATPATTDGNFALLNGSSR